jgi:hypothetical protein
MGAAPVKLILDVARAAASGPGKSRLHASLIRK